MVAIAVILETRVFYSSLEGNVRYVAESKRSSNPPQESRGSDFARRPAGDLSSNSKRPARAPTRQGPFAFFTSRLLVDAVAVDAILAVAVAVVFAPVSACLADRL